MMAARPSPISHLRELLREDQPLPKDNTLKETLSGGRLHRFQPRDRKDERALLRLLVGRHATKPEKMLAAQIAHCSPGRPCGSWICYICRHRYWASVRYNLKSTTKGLGTNDISFLTLVAGVTNDGETGVASLIQEAREGVSLVLDKWPRITANGRFEVDWLQPGERATTYKDKTLRQLGYEEGSEVNFVPHLHALVVHPGIKRGKIKFWLRKSFPGSRRVNLKIKKHLAISYSLDNLVRYSLKFTLPARAIPMNSTEDAYHDHLPDPLHFCRLIESLGGLNGVLSYTHERFGRAGRRRQRRP